MIRGVSRLELRQLRYFVMLAEELHFGRSAERLHVVQPAVTQQIQKLERELKVTLFDRSKRSVNLTDAGQRLLPEARAVLATVNQAIEAVTGLTEQPNSGHTLRIGTADGLGARLDSILSRLHDTTPDLKLSLESATTWSRLERVRNGELDAAFVRILRKRNDIPTVPVWVDHLVAAVPAGHVLAGQSSLMLHQLADLPLRLVPRKDSPAFVDMITEACRSAGFEPTLGPPFTTLQNSLAEIGAGPPTWTVLYEGTICTIPPKRVAYRPLADNSMAITTSLAVRSMTPMVKRLVEACSFAAQHDPRHGA